MFPQSYHHHSSGLTSNNRPSPLSLPPPPPPPPIITTTSQSNDRLRARTISFQSPLSPDLIIDCSQNALINPVYHQHPSLNWSHLSTVPEQIIHSPPSSDHIPNSESNPSSVESTPPATPISFLPSILSSPPPPINLQKAQHTFYNLPLDLHPTLPSWYRSQISTFNSSTWTRNPARLQVPRYQPSPASSPLLSSHSSFKPSPSPSLLPRLSLLVGLLLGSFLFIVLLVSTIPGLHLPTSLAIVREQIAHLRAYSAHSPTQAFHLISALAIIFVWKQAFSVPGTVLLNVLLGALYGTWFSTALTCLLTALGSTLAYAMARVARPAVERFVPKPLHAVQEAVDRFKLPGQPGRYDVAELSSYLLIARLLPVVPYAALNLASGVLELPLGPFFWTLVIGSLPYNFVTTQVGDILGVAADARTVSSIWSAELLMRLLLVSVTGVVPVLMKGRLRSWIGRAKRAANAGLAARRRRQQQLPALSPFASSNPSGFWAALTTRSAEDTKESIMSPPTRKVASVVSSNMD